MSEKLYEYTGCLGWWHGTMDRIRERWNLWKESHPEGVKDCCKDLLKKENINLNDIDNEDYSHVYRRKTRKELIRVSAAVMGIEFSYAAETAFVSPTLLKIGVEHQHMTLVWALSPLIGFFLTPILGSLSDRCHLRFGRRRPFIFFMSLGVLLGLILVPNGESLGLALGDISSPKLDPNVVVAHRTSANKYNIEFENSTSILSTKQDNTGNHPWGIFFTVLGTVLLDFDADACQSPSRAYLLDVTVPDDHAKGLSTFTIMAGLGGFLGYGLGGINWDVTFIGALLGGHVKVVFTIITIIFIVCVSYTITSFTEIPLYILEMQGENLELDSSEIRKITSRKEQGYGSLDNNEENVSNNHQDDSELPAHNPAETKKPFLQRGTSTSPSADASLIMYLKSIIYMPKSIKMICVTNLFCWMAHVCYSLYFTDFVGEAVFEGVPTAPLESSERIRYEEGVRFGCWGMAMYSLSCACYSMIIDKLIHRFGAKKVYVTDLLIYSCGMLLMALLKNKIGVILFSWTAGVMYSTLFTMPYLLVAHYHAHDVFELTPEGEAKVGGHIRGLGTDVAIVSSMVFLAQFILSICMGSIVSIANTTTAVVSVASFLAFCGAISATRVMYLEL